MVKTGWIEKLSQDLVNEREAKIALAALRGHDVLREHQATLKAELAAIGKTGDIDQILAAERTILNNDLVHHTNSAAMRGSLQDALNEHGAAQRLLERVRQPDRYQVVDETHSLPKNRIGGVPRDEARQFFRAHRARLLNMDKSRLDDTEKKVIEERRRNLRVAEKAYTELQFKALGLEPEKGKDKGRTRA